jgi:hypothetical protein
LRQEDAKWSDQFKSILIPILKLLKHKLVRFILMDGLKSHLKFLLKNLKFDNKHLTLRWIPDMFHLFAHFANFLAGKFFITVQLLGKPVKLKFNGSYFENNETWNHYRGKADTDISWLRKFWSKKFIRKTIRAMEGVSNRQKKKLGIIFDKLIDFLAPFPKL